MHTHSDIAYANGDTRASPGNAWDRAQALHAPLAGSIALAAAEGNHDWSFGERARPMRARLAPPARHYALRRGAVRTLLLATEEESSRTLDSAQLRWLRAQLVEARKDQLSRIWFCGLGLRLERLQRL